MPPGDEQAVPQTDDAGDGERAEAGDRGRLVMIDLQLGGDDAGERDAGADGEIDAADEDHQRHADADDDDLGDLRRQVREVPGREEGVARLGMKREADPQQQEDADHAQAARRQDANELYGVHDAVPIVGMRPGGVGDDVILRGARGQLGDDAPLAQDEDAIGEALHLGQIGRRHQHGDAAAARGRRRARRSPRARRRRRRASARRAGARAAADPATCRARPSAGCRPRASPPASRRGRGCAARRCACARWSRRRRRRRARAAAPGSRRR